MIKKITVSVGKKEIELTYAEAQKLYADLGLLFDKPVTLPYFPYSPPKPTPFWSSTPSGPPLIIGDPWTTTSTCGDSQQ